MPSIRDYPALVTTTNATIANGAATSTAVDLCGVTLAGIQLPASFTGTSITFQAATSLGGTYQTIINPTGASVGATVSAGKYLTLSPSDFAGIQFLKIVSGSNEGADRTLELVCRPM